MSLQDAIQRVQAAADAQANGTPTDHRKLLDEIHKLRMIAETPGEKLMRMRFQKLENLSIRLAIEYGILQAIAAKQGKDVTAAELANETDADELLIIRMMRLVTYVGVANETGYGQYASNECTALITTRGHIAGELHHTDLTIGVGAKLIEMKRKHGLCQFPEGEDEKSPFQYAFGYPMFEYFHHDQEQKDAFDAWMSVRRDPNAKQWFDIFPVKDVFSNAGSDDVLIVDVGGGVGHEISNFRKKFPDLKGRLVLQDRPETFKGIKVKPRGIELMEHDFFTEQPVKRSRAYYLRNIMHDWSDQKCKTILSEIVKAMDPKTSRVLIDDYVLPDTGADQRSAGMDMLMFFFVSGMERTKRQWDTLLASAGLEIVKIWTSDSGTEPVIEARVIGSN